MTGRRRSWAKKAGKRLALLLRAHRRFLLWRGRRWGHHLFLLRRQPETDYEAAVEVVQGLTVLQVLQRHSLVVYSQEGCPSCAVEEVLIREQTKIHHIARRMARRQNPLLRLRRSLHQHLSPQGLDLPLPLLHRNHFLPLTRWLPIFANRRRGRRQDLRQPCRRGARRMHHRHAHPLRCQGRRNLHLLQYLQGNPLLQLLRLFRLLPVLLHLLLLHLLPLLDLQLLRPLLHGQPLRLRRLPHPNLRTGPLPLQ